MLVTMYCTVFTVSSKLRKVLFLAFSVIFFCLWPPYVIGQAIYIFML